MNRPLQEALSSLRQEHHEITAPDSIKRGLEHGPAEGAK